MTASGARVPTYARGDYVKVEFPDEASGIDEWMWLGVDHCDEEQKLVFGTLDNEPLNDYGEKVRLGPELVVSYAKVREHRRAPKSGSATQVHCRTAGYLLRRANALAKTKKSSVSYAGFKPSSPAASNMGRGNSSTGTAPEKTLLAALRRAGLRFRANVRSLPGCPDVVLREFPVAVFCDGDFWHGRRWSQVRERIADGANARYWVPKIERNIQRDKVVNRSLRKLGWRVVRVWESAVLNDPDHVASRLLAIAKRTR